MSIAAIAALFATGANAFDTDMNGRLLKQEGTKYIKGDYTWDAAKNMKAAADLTAAPAGQLGDALVYPAFFSDHGWESEFTVINNGDEAMVAKVVLYSRDNSKELKDFNIYLSAHDVFRATLKENKLIIKDSSFVFQSKTPEQKTNVGYTYTDTATDASKHNISEPIPEGAGYITVYGMVQADEATTTTTKTKVINGEDITAYHKNHDNLWRDYRHLVDECRGEAWRGGISEGIYDAAGLIAPNINTADATCGTIKSTVRNRTDDVIHFKSPDTQLSGSITLKGNDSRGTRAMTLNAVPLTNYTDDAVAQGMLWTEGEFASIADRRIGAGTASTAGFPKYYGTEILADSTAFTPSAAYKYEYNSAAGNAFVLTQPHKRTLVQLVNNVSNGTKQHSCVMNSDGDNTVSTASFAWKGVKRDNTGAENCLITNYGAFDVTRALYDDNENLQTAAAGGFTFSPATVTAEVNQAPGEVTMISSIVSDSDKADGYTSGYAEIAIPVPGIATQMTATDVDGNAETNWIYSGSMK